MGEHMSIAQLWVPSRMKDESGGLNSVPQSMIRGSILTKSLWLYEILTTWGITYNTFLCIACPWWFWAILGVECGPWDSTEQGEVTREMVCLIQDSCRKFKVKTSATCWHSQVWAPVYLGYVNSHIMNITRKLECYGIYTVHKLISYKECFRIPVYSYGSTSHWTLM